MSHTTTFQKTLLKISGLLCLCFSVLNASDTCIRFTRPLAGSVIYQPNCTIAISTECSNISRVEFIAQFQTTDNQVEKKSLGLINRAPFKLIWKTDNIPNQHYSGITLFAKAELSDRTTTKIKQEGIFLLHHGIELDEREIPYSYAGLNLADDFIYPLDTSSPNASSGSLSWNENKLLVIAEIDHPDLQNAGLKQLENSGVEILINPGSDPKPYLNNNILNFYIPLSGTPLRISHNQVFSSDGSFGVESKRQRTAYPHLVKRTGPSTYVVNFHIPKEIFEDGIPDNLGCNIIIKLSDKTGNITMHSWSGGGHKELYSPTHWHRFYKRSKPFYLNWSFLWGVFFTIGFSVAYISTPVIKKIKRSTAGNKKRTEEEFRLFEKLHSFIDKELTKKDLDIEYISVCAELSPSKLNKIVRRNTGYSFSKYLMFCRIELACERLRSSRSSEASIADLCGFSDVNQMEKYFMKFHRTTPFKYRQEQQVS
ncbi:hypothetical protein CHISP_1849 [Chitinispirillum alkaliphilum]|nr:hypothetical protein CHISP_1849 [Chitinispirillum alkaliphilum]